MAQPYDLSGIAAAEATIDQMIADQASGTTKFAGGYETWAPTPRGGFTAVLTIGGAATPTTTNNVRAQLTVLRTLLDLIAGTTGVAAEIAAAAAVMGGFSLETGSRGAAGPSSAAAGVIQDTNYDLSGLAALFATVKQMMADQRAGVTNFAGGPFEAVLVAGQAPQSVTIAEVRLRLAALRAKFDRLAQ